MRTITVVTATRAEYGLLRPVVQKIAASDVLDLQRVVTGAHLCPRLGETVHEIEADGLPIAARLPIFTDNADEPVAKTIARTMEIFDNHFAAHRPDAVLLLGDRYEIFAVAAAAAARHIPIAHISGGDVTLGAADEYYRHCISKMAAVHFPSCADSAARLVRMGEAPDTVFCVGGLGDENIRTLPKMSREELCKSTGFDLMQPFALVTYHPETAPDAGSPAVQVQALCDAMAAVDGVFWLITGSNADAGGQVCTAMMQTFAAAHPDTLVITSGGQGRDEWLPEGDAMRDYLIAKGLPADRVLAESGSTSTEENFAFSLTILREHGFDETTPIVYVSNAFHCYRAGKYAALAGFTKATALPAATPLRSVLPCYLREALALLYYWVFKTSASGPMHAMVGLLELNKNFFYK